MSQIIPKYIHPHVNVVINDNTITSTTSFSTPIVANPSISITPTSLSLVIGSIQQFIVTTRNLSTGDSVVITVAGNTSDSTYITSSGLLTIGLDETADSLIITAATTVSKISAGSNITLLKPSIVFNPNSITAIIGTATQFNLVKTNLTNSDVITYTLTGNTSGSTSVNSTTNTLIVAGDETASELKLVASVAKYSISSELTAKVQAIPTIDISPKDLSIARGTTSTMTITTTDIPDGGVLIASTNSSNPTTTFNTDGELSISDTEALDELTLRVSLQGTSIYGETSVDILAPTIAIEPETVTVIAGRTQQFTLTKENLPDSIIPVYTVTGNTSTNTNITSEGLLTVGSDENADSLVVRVVVVAFNLSDTADVIVEDAPLIPTLNIDPEIVDVYKGRTQQFTVTTQNVPVDIIPVLTLTGNTSDETTLTDEGLLTIASDETATELTITAEIASMSLTKVATATVNELPTIVLNPATVTLNKGDIETFIATVVGIDDYVLTYTLEGNNSATTVLNYNILTIGSDETSDSLSVTATINGLDVSFTSIITIQATIDISPDVVSVMKGQTEQFTTVVNNAPEGSIIDIAVENNTSADTTVTAEGLLTIAVDETATELNITASIDAISISDTSVVTVLEIPTIEIDPKTVDVIKGQSQQFTSVVEHLTTYAVTYELTGSTNLNTTISSDGLVEIAVDETATELTVTATINGYSISDAATINVKEIPSIDIQPKDAELYYTDTQQYSVTKVNIPDTAVVSYIVENGTSDNTTISSDGLLIVAADETSLELTITASIEAMSLTSTTNVSLSPLPTIELTPETAELNPSNTQQFTATVDGIDVYNVLFTMTGNTSVGTNITSSGLLTVGADEVDTELTITSTIEGFDVSDTSTVTVIDLPDPTISISPTTADVYKTQSEQFTVTLGHVEAGTTATVSVTGNTSANTTVDNTGLLTVGADETATELTLTATVESLSISDTATVTILDLPTIELTPETADVIKTESQQFTATVAGIDSYNVTYTLEDNTSTDTVITTSGLLTVGADETATEVTVIATIDTFNVSDMSIVTVVEQTPVITITPETVSVLIGDTYTFTIVEEHIPEGETVTSTLTGNISVDTTFDKATGLLTVAADETATELIVELELASQSITDTATITVLYPSLTITPETADVIIGETQQFTLTKENITEETPVGYTITGYASDVETVLDAGTTISVDGLLTVSIDETTVDRIVVTASTTGATAVSDTATVNILYPSILVTPDAVESYVDASIQFTTTASNLPEGEVIETSLVGNVSVNTTLTAEGLLTIAVDETAEQLFVTSHNETYDVYGTGTVTMRYPSLTVDENDIFAVVGETHQFVLTKTDFPEGEDITVTLEGNTSASTTMTTDGLLTVASDEDNTSHDITITMTLDTVGISETITVRIVEKTADLTFDNPPTEVSVGGTSTISVNELVIDYTGSGTITPEMMTISYRVENNTSIDTTIVPVEGTPTSATLSIGTDETATNVNVITSNEYFGINVETSVTIVEPVKLPYLTFSGDTPFTLSTGNVSKNWDGVLEYSTDGNSWNEWNSTSISSNDDGNLYMRGIGNTVITGGNTHIFNFTNATNLKCIGNIEYLLDYETVNRGEHPVMGSSCYRDMFYGCTSLTRAPELPATTLTDTCYRNMFYGCTSLTRAPELPATTLTDNCYNSMFEDCTSLTRAPELPATTLTKYCYNGMFEDCTSLTQAPELPATTLGYGCYNSMFYGCTSLTQAPELPATTLTEYCYNSMFYGCRSLTQAPELPATTLTEYCYTSMFYGCRSLKISNTQTVDSPLTWRIPSNGTISSTINNWNTSMLVDTGGSFVSDPYINTTYYTSVVV